MGSRAEAEHQAIADLAAHLGLELLAVDTDLYGVDAIPHGEVIARMSEEGMLGDGTAVLVKGSRVAGLEEVAHVMVEGAGGSYTSA
ncbi:MAG: hypothetical protein M5U19_15705 [Microthrixaceae bacterium]|nr:hypothetical protein [Microthrixaceae bacterium]